MATSERLIQPTKRLSARVTGATVFVRDKSLPEQMQDFIRRYNPKSDLGKLILKAAPHLPIEMAYDLVDRLASIVVAETALGVKVRRFCERSGLWVVDDYGMRPCKVITTAGVNFLVADWDGTASMDTMKFHGLGTGTGTESVSQTALGTELTTQYATANVRATGSLTVGSANNIFSTVGANTLSATPGASVSEFGLFSSATVGAGTMWDRVTSNTTFGPYPLVSGNTLTSTYQVTFTPGG
jgi:hypothetical protein